MAMTGTPLPYRKTETTPNLGAVDATDDIRGGMGLEGLAELATFVREGGTLITEGSTTTIFPEYGLTTGVTIETPAQLFARGTIVRSRIADMSSPLVYGYAGPELPVYFNQAPVLSVDGRGGAPAAAPNAGFGQTITPNAAPLRIAPYEPALARESGTDSPASSAPAAERPRVEDRDAVRQQSGPATEGRPRVVVQFVSDASQLLLSGTLANGQFLAGRAAAIDQPLGRGHIVMFAIRPFWRWQTHGTYTLGFNAIMNWNDLDAGK